MDLHERLSEALRLRGMTQRDLAHAIDYSEATISKWVQGRALPPTAALVDVCTALTISADWLLWGGELSEQQPIETTPRWETVDTNFSTSSTSFDEFLEPARSLFFTSAWLPRAFDSHNPVLSRLVSQGITMRFVFPHPELTLVPYNTDGLESHNQHQRKRLRVLSSLYQLQDWQTRCQVELRLIMARPVNNIVAINAESSQGKILYVPYLYGDFEHGARPGFIISQQQQPDWYAVFHSRYVDKLWSDATPVDDINNLISTLSSEG